MFGTVLVPLDGSPDAERAIPYAADEARRHGCALVLVRVIPRPERVPGRVPHGGPLHSTPHWPTAELQAAERSAAEYLRDVIVRHGLAPETETATPIGDPYTRLLAEIQRRPQPLVVLATSGATGSLSQGLGETARRLLLSGAAPVLCVRIDQPPSPTAKPLPPPSTPEASANADASL